MTHVILALLVLFSLGPIFMHNTESKCVTETVIIVNGKILCCQVCKGKPSFVKTVNGKIEVYCERHKPDGHKS